jgi:hypothetical protein
MTLEETGNFTGTITDMGPLYPWVGLEGAMAIVLLVVWVAWHIWQISQENAILRQEAETVRKNGNVEAMLRGGHLKT